MFRSSIALLGKALWLVFLIGLFAVSVSLIWERHLLPGCALGFFTICMFVSSLLHTVAASKNELCGYGENRWDEGCLEAQDVAMYEATQNVALVAVIAAAEGRDIVVGPNGKEMNSGDDDSLLDPFDISGFGSVCTAPTGDDRF